MPSFLGCHEYLSSKNENIILPIDVYIAASINVLESQRKFHNIGIHNTVNTIPVIITENAYPNISLDINIPINYAADI